MKETGFDIEITTVCGRMMDAGTDACHNLEKGEKKRFPEFVMEILFGMHYFFSRDILFTQ